MTRQGSYRKGYPKALWNRCALPESRVVKVNADLLAFEALPNYIAITTVTASSGILTRCMYRVHTGMYRVQVMYIDAMVWYRHVLQCTDMYRVHTNMYFYLKVCTGMYQVHTIYHWYVLVHTKGPKYVPGTYFSRLVPVCTSMYLVHTGTYSCCTTFVSILKGTSLFILTSSQYVLLTSGFFCAPPPRASRFACQRFMHLHIL